MGKSNRFLRTCIVCSKKGKKDEFFRLGLEKGMLILDRKKTLPGRGAYICSLMCMQKLSKIKLERALKSKIVDNLEILKISSL
ncbi:MAG: YlxR family protein [Proteobacteria bacterium]|nr:YlxR family protein [Pseudomonadota bacterium]